PTGRGRALPRAAAGGSSRCPTCWAATATATAIAAAAAAVGGEVGAVAAAPGVAFRWRGWSGVARRAGRPTPCLRHLPPHRSRAGRSEEHTSELQSRENLVCLLLL